MSPHRLLPSLQDRCHKTVSLDKCGANATGSRVVQGEKPFVRMAPGAVDAFWSVARIELSVPVATIS